MAARFRVRLPQSCRLNGIGFSHRLATPWSYPEVVVSNLPSLDRCPLARRRRKGRLGMIQAMFDAIAL